AFLYQHHRGRNTSWDEGKLAMIKRSMFVLGVFVSVIYEISSIAEESVAKSALAKDYYVDFLKLSPSIVATWGAHFPYEFIYTPFDRKAHAKNVDLYSLASSTLAPTSKATKLEGSEETQFLNMLFSEQGLTFLGIKGSEIADGGVPLSNYCEERHDRHLIPIQAVQMQALGLLTVRCVPKA